MPFKMKSGQINSLYTKKNLKSTDEVPHFEKPVNMFKIDPSKIDDCSDESSFSDDEPPPEKIPLEMLKSKKLSDNFKRIQRKI